MCGVSFEEALLSGVAADGGLFLPEDLPVLTRQEWMALAPLSYPQMVKKFLKIFIGEELSVSEIEGNNYFFIYLFFLWHRPTFTS